VAILVDPASWTGRGRLWAHLVSDTSFAELHAFAAGVGLPERAFERDHYDIPAERRADVIAAGAQPVSSKELVARLTAAGLRRPKHRPAP
jgi:acetyl-CoA acetyltransferase